MTLPSERTRSVQQARKFLRSLLDPRQTPRVPKSVRIEAYWVLRHFPTDLDLDRAAAASNTWAPVPDEARETLALRKPRKRT